MSNSSASTNCPVCCEVFGDPKIIACGHIICHPCLVTWLEAREMKAGCPLCRFPIFELRIPGYPSRLLAEIVASALPTDLDLKAAARGSYEGTPESCRGCEDLLCLSTSNLHPLCPRQQDPQATSQREVEARATFTALVSRVEQTVEHTDRMQDFLKDTEEQFRALVARHETVANMKAQAVQLASRMRNRVAELKTVLLTHKHLLERLRRSRPVITIVMAESMQDRLNFLTRKLEKLKQSYLEDSRQLCRCMWKVHVDWAEWREGTFNGQVGKLRTVLFTSILCSGARKPSCRCYYRDDGVDVGQEKFYQ